MNNGESFSVGANGTDEKADDGKVWVESYNADKAHEGDVAGLEAAFRAALVTRAEQLEAEGLSQREAVEQAIRASDEAYERSKKNRRNEG